MLLINILVFVLTCVFNVVESSIFTAVHDAGTYTIILVFNNETIHTDNVMLTSYNLTTRTVYFQTVSPTSTAQNILCRISSQRRVIWGPCGCSSINNPSQALQSANCLADNVSVELYRRLFSENWYKSKLSSLCAVPGDIRVCSGPMRLAIENRDPFFDWGEPTVEDVLRSRMVFVTGLIGPMGKSPYTVRVNMVLPAIEMDTDCMMPPGVPYQGNYSNYELDNKNGFLSIVWKVFKSNGNDYQRILLRRTDPFGLKFSIVLANVLAGGGEYNLDAWSDPIDSSLQLSESLFLDWVQSIEWGRTYNMTSPSGNCTMTLTIPSTFTHNIVKPYTVTPFNYTDNVNPRTLWVSAVCNVCYGRLDIVGNLVCPDVPEGDVGGGYVKYVYPGDIHLPVYVPPNPNLHYRFDCDEAYPRAEFFFDTAGIKWFRSDPDITQLCYYPMYYTGDDIQEKGRQCQLMGGYTWTRAQTLCARPMTLLLCQTGWIYFGDRCFYKFDPVLEGQYSSPIDQAQLTCSELNRYSQPVVEVDQDLNTFLRRTYMFWKINTDVGASYRVPVYGRPYCACFMPDLEAEVPCPCYDILYDQRIPIFPVCFYYTSVKELEPLYSDIQVSLETARVWRYGQEGPDMGSYEATCSSYDGWKDKGSNTVTCLVRSILNEAKQNSTLVNFFKKCYANGHGSCFNGQPRCCMCSPYYGPSACILPTFPDLYQFQDNPCGCPAGVRKSGMFSINGNVYNSSSLYVPCTSIFHGDCLIANNTGAGTCLCKERENLVFGGMESAFQGKGCGCRVPIQPVKSISKNGPIVVDFCNRHGTCCPFGETVHDRDGNLYKRACFNQKEGISYEGCVGDNGWGGPASTCPTAFDVVGDRRWESFNNGQLYYKNLGSKTIMHWVKVRDCGQNLTVFLSDEVGKSSVSLECFMDLEQDLYRCDANEGYEYVVVGGLTLSDNCIAEAFDTFFNYCGFNHTTNPFAGSFFNNPAYRGPNKNLEEQSAMVASHGCTSTDCMCNSNYTGFHCNTGVSSLRYILTENGERRLSQMVCGETISDATLENPVQGRGSINSDTGICECNSVSSIDITGSSGVVYQYFAGKACEYAVMYNWDRDEVLNCTGHGEIDLANFPYGGCGVDVSKYRSDALYYPFIPKRGTENQYNRMTAEENTYFLLSPLLSPGTQFPTQAPTPPTRSPTVDPTERPTTQPTSTPTRSPFINTSPTTLPTPSASEFPTRAPYRAPTKFPTPPTVPTTPAIPYVMRLFDSGIVGNGTINGMGWDGLKTECENVALSTGLGCVNTIPFLLNDVITTFDELIQYLGCNEFDYLYGKDNNRLGVIGRAFYINGPITNFLSMTLKAAGVFPPSYDDYRSSFTDYTCNNWTVGDNTYDTPIALTTSVDLDWLTFVPKTCDFMKRFGCACKDFNVVTQSPTSPTTKSPTSSIARGIMYETLSYSKGDIGSPPTAGQICLQNANRLGLSCLYALPNLNYIYWNLKDVPKYYNFDPNLNVYSMNGTFICKYVECFTALVPLATSLIAAGVTTEISFWLSGGFTTGVPFTDNCDQFTSGLSLDTAQLSDNRLKIATWSKSIVESCDQLYKFSCTCVQGVQVRSPTRKPTVRPTRPPTTRPATKFPTFTPTREPTPSTSSPTFNALENRPIQYLYRLSQGESVSALNVFYNLTITHERSSPVKMRINPAGTSLVPVLWTSLVYRVFDPITSLTVTRTLGICNPGTPSWIPGTFSIQPDGYKTCPTVDKCIQTTDCTDNLSPSDTSIPLSGFPDLRACWCSHSEIVYFEASALDPLVEVDLLLFEGSLSLSESVKVPSDVTGVFYCNNFIDRTINCQFRQQDPLYYFRCADEPIGCFDGSIGYGFGAFDEQNTKFIYPTEQKDWGIGHYRGVASILNNLTYLKDGEFVDPLDSDILNRYYWIKINETGTILSVELELGLDVYQTSLLQAVSYMDLLDNIPPPILERQITISQKDIFKSCYGLFTPFCAGLDWTSTNINGPVGRKPGVYSYISSSNVTYLSFTFTSKSNPGNKRIVGIEVYNSLDVKCGGMYNNDGFEEGVEFTISCLPLSSQYTIFQDGAFSIRFLGISSIYDIPGATLNSEYFHSPYDPLLPYLDLLLYSGSSQSLNLPLAGIYDVFSTNPLNWPQRQWFNQSFLTDIGFTVTANYTYTIDGQTVTNAWNSISNTITNHNVYPENFPLRDVQHLYDTVETDYEDPYVLRYLYEIWATHLAKRRCGGVDYDCETQQLGQCIIETPYDQVWWNIGTDVNYEHLGNEGGCLCYSDFERGFYNFPLLCHTCEDGFAPLSRTEMSLIIQYNSLVSQVYEPNLFPITATDISIDEFESSYSCRYPSGYDPVPASLAPVNFCAGHGIVKGFNSTVLLPFRVWDGKYLIGCTSLIGDSEFILSNQTTSQYSIIYTNSTSFLTVVGDQYTYKVYIIGSSIIECQVKEVLDLFYPYPFRIVLVCGDTVMLTCKNDWLFSVSDVKVFRDVVYTHNPFLMII